VAQPALRQSPNADNGYDIRDDPHRDYYLWRDGKPDGSPPNNYPSFFGGSAWRLDPTTGQYYLHYFDVKQSDLNWENPRVRAEVFDIMRFWLDKGVAGFRMDVIPFISKHPGLPDYLCNHDNPRTVSHFGDDSPAWRERSAKALATLMLTQRATPFLYQGDELGMTNYPFRSVEDFDDVEVRDQWRQSVETGLVPAAEYLDHVRQTSRDNSRTPRQWSAEPHGGFTTSQPWLAVTPNYVEINAAAQFEDPDSVFHHHRRLIALRRQAPALVQGAYLDIDPKDEQVFAYTRTGKSRWESRQMGQR
jgi:glycosidase